MNQIELFSTTNSFDRPPGLNYYFEHILIVNEFSARFPERSENFHNFPISISLSFLSPFVVVYQQKFVRLISLLKNEDKQLNFPANEILLPKS